MRIDVKKVLFMGLCDQKKRFFEKAQDAGFIDFIDPNKSSAEETPHEIQAIIQGIKILRKLPPSEQKEVYDYELAPEIAEKIIAINHDLEKKLEEERVVKLEIARVEIFGNFSVQDLEFIRNDAKKYVQFFCAKKGLFHDNNLAEDFIFVGSENGLDYFISISNHHQENDDMIEMKVDLPANILKEKLKLIKKEIDELERKLKTYVRYNDFLHRALIDRMNVYALVTAQSQVEYEMNDALFVAQGWVAVDKEKELQNLVNNFDIEVVEIAIEESDRVPTYLENSGGGRIGEDLVHIYDTPSIEDKDPSLWVLVFFSLFFSFIIGDGGYGLIFLAVAIYLRFKFKNAKNVGKRFINLVTILSISCVVWGFLTTSFFGISFGPDNPLQKVSLVNTLVHKKVEYHWKHKDSSYQEWVKQFPEVANMKSPQEIIENATTEKNGIKGFELQKSFIDGIMLEMALLIGMIHISLSFARYLKRNWAGFGWILFIIGAYCYFPYYLGVSSMLNYVVGLHESVIGPNGLYLIIGGLSLAVVLSIIQNKLMGLLEIMTVIQVFSDVLSYLRLYALGLAGGIVSATINELAGSVIFVGGILIIILGHMINIALAVMGGVIHGLRLNFLEWYHYSFIGGGKMFEPLRKLEVD